MKRLLPYIILIPMVAFALIPPISIGLETPSPYVTTWLILIATFFGFYTLFLKTNVFVKIIAVGGFINCFFSTMPYTSFIAYISLVACCYFFILCAKIENWTPVFKALQTVIFINVVLIIIQITGHDNLLNFGLGHINCYGTIGSNNQVGGLVSTITALLVSFSPFNFLAPLIIGALVNSTGLFISGTVGVFVWSILKNKRLIMLVMLGAFIGFFMVANKSQDIQSTNVRIAIWQKTIELANRHPFTGWGIGTYKYIMNAFMPTYRMAHNLAFQVLFEFGYPGLLLLIGSVGTLIYKLIKTKEFICLAGLSIVIADSMGHFPDRQIQVVLILIAFLAYCVSRVISNITKGRGIGYG